jgi:hypothetical protein
MHNEKVNNLYASPNIIRVMKSRRMTGAGHVTWTGDLRNACSILVGQPEGKHHLEDLGINGKTI